MEKGKKEKRKVELKKREWGRFLFDVVRTESYLRDREYTRLK